MPRIVGIDLFELDLPFRQAFRHAAAERTQSSSVFVRFRTDSGHSGYGETLPRRYVTGEDQAGTFDLLAAQILPRVLGMDFASFAAVHAFLTTCDGKAPASWIARDTPQSAAWCAVDLVLLDTFARAFGIALQQGLPGQATVEGAAAWPEELGYGVVISGGPIGRIMATLLKARLYGIRDLKVKVAVERHSMMGVWLARHIFGRGARLRVDSNMAWTYEQAREAMMRLREHGVASFEQPLAADDLAGLARLAGETGLAIIADESFHDAASLDRLIAARACTGVNVRIAKCGGLIASLARCRQALRAGLTLQIGCLVGETSQLSAAQLVLVRALGQAVRTVEGCFGERLLQIDPVRPLLQFGRRGQPPRAPEGTGFATTVDMQTIRRYSGRRLSFGVSVPLPTQERT